MENKQCRRCGRPTKNPIQITVQGISKKCYLCDKCDTKVGWEEENAK